MVFIFGRRGLSAWDKVWAGPFDELEAKKRMFRTRHPPRLACRGAEGGEEGGEKG